MDAPDVTRAYRTIARIARIVLIALIAMVTALATSTRVRAQDATTPESASDAADASTDDASPERVEARQRYQQGVVFYRAERYREAIAEFTAAYAAWDNPLILYSLGQSYEHLLEVPRAIDAYTRFLAAVPEDDARRAEVTAKVDTLRLLLATLRVESNVPASIWVNGEELGRAPGEVELAVGRWDVEIRAEGYATHRESVSLAARATETLSVTLAPAGETRVVERGGEVPLPVFVALAVGAVLASGAAIGLGVHTLDLAHAYGGVPMGTVADQAAGRTWSTATDIVGIAGAALAISAFVVAFLTDWDGPAPASAPTARLVIGPDGAMMSLGGSF